jgi:predicted homoserine dehydrogenase-like protein
MARVIETSPEFQLAAILTRRPPAQSAHLLPEEYLTNSIDRLVEAADVIIECSGDTVHAAEVMMAAGLAGRPVITMNSEAQVTVVSEFVRRGFWITEAHGDQPGCLAELADEARAMCFRPLAYVNLKGFLNPDPSREDMLYWSARQGLTLRQVTSFTDGSKLQIEQALVANALGARIVRQGMIGGRADDLAELDALARAARDLSAPISDYVVNPGGPPGVLILAESPIAATKEGYLPFTRLLTKEGEAYVLLRPHHLVHLEIGKTLRRVARGEPPLLNNGSDPTATVAAVAKRAIPAGTLFEEALGGFDLRGEAVEIAGHEDVVPITLLDGARLRHAIEPGHVISQGDVDVPETLACELYWSKSTRQRPTGFLGRAAGELSPLSDRLLLGEVAALRSRPVLQLETGADGAAFTSP